MKKFTKKIIYQEYGKLIMDLRTIQKEKLPEISKKFSYLHFDKTYFSDTYTKKDEKKFWEIIYFTSDFLTKSKCKIEKELVEKCLQENQCIYSSISSLTNKKDEFDEILFESILQNHPQPNLISHLLEVYMRLDSDFSSFYTALYSFICAKSIIDATIISDAKGFPIDDDLADKLCWAPIDYQNDFDDDFDDDEESDKINNIEELESKFKEFITATFPESVSEAALEDPNFLRNLLENEPRDINEETDELIEIREKYTKLLENDSQYACTKRKNLLKKALDLYPEDIQLYLMLVAEYKSLDKKIEICDEALEIAKTFIGDEKEFKKIEKKQLFGIVPTTKAYIEVLFAKAAIFRNVGAFHCAYDIFEKMLELCPSDGLGARVFYLEALLEHSSYKNNNKEINDLIDRFSGDELPSIPWTKIFLLLNNDKIAEAKIKLKKAKNNNKYVSKFLLNRKEYFIDFTVPLVRGSKEEAENYCGIFKRFWSKDNLKKLRKIIIAIEKD